MSETIDDRHRDDLICISRIKRNTYFFLHYLDSSREGVKVSIVIYRSIHSDETQMVHCIFLLVYDFHNGRERHE